MYEMKKLLPQFDIQLPICMYKMKNISLSATSVAHTKSQQIVENITSIDVPSNTNLKGMSNSHDPEVVVKRQEKLLNQLNDLKNQLAKIRSTLGMSDKNVNKLEGEMYNLCNERNRETLCSHDIVVNGNPKLIPYSLLALQHLWKDIYTIEFKIFKHSTIRELTAEAKAFEEVALKSMTPSSSSATNDVVHNNNTSKLRITLVWKECAHTEMICSLAKFVPIYGEVNILRYLARIGPNAYHYDDADNVDISFCNEIDSLLDMCHILVQSRHNARVRLDIMQKLQRHLNNREYFIGNALTIADIAIYSSLKRIDEITDIQLSPNMLSWRKRIHQMTII